MNICQKKETMMETKYYDKVYSTVSGRWVRIYIKIWEDFMQTPVPEGCVIHHLDQNRNNNRLDNLVCMEDIDHKRWHGKHQRAETIEKIIKGNHE